jgi:hypothetical protein
MLPLFCLLEATVVQILTYKNVMMSQSYEYYWLSCMHIMNVVVNLED